MMNPKEGVTDKSSFFKINGTALLPSANNALPSVVLNPELSSFLSKV
jgi:hypothetical protein